jgi:hypothetical protein
MIMNNVRNFWVTLDVDGRSSAISAGPRSKDGGFDLDVRMRDDGCTIKPVSITGRAYDDGRLVLRIYVEGREETVTIETKR